MKHTNAYSLCQRLLCMLLILLILAPGAATASGLPALVNHENLYDQIKSQSKSEIYVISEKEFVVLVQKYDAAQKRMVPENDLTVTVKTEASYRTKGAEKTVKTSSGMAIFQIDDFRTEAHRKATRYFYADVNVVDETSQKRQTWHDPECLLIAGQKKKVVLSQNNKEPYVYEASFNGSDVLMSEYKAYITPKNDGEHSLRVIIDEGYANISSVTGKIMSGDKKLMELTSTTKNGHKFTLEFKHKWLHTSGLSVGQKVSLVYSANGGAEKTLPLSITVLKAPRDEPQTNLKSGAKFQFGIDKGELTVTLPDAIPYVGNSTFKIKLPKAPITFYMDHTGKLILGVTLNFSKQPFSNDNDKKNWKFTNDVQVTNWISETLSEFKKDREKLKSNVTPLKGCFGKTPWMPKFELTFTAGVMVKGDNIFAKPGRDVSVGSYIFASMGAKLSVRKYLMAGPVPFYIGGSLQGSIMASLDARIIVKQDDPMKTMRNTGDTPIDGELEFTIAASLGISVTAGIGFEDFLSIWAEGSVTMLPSVTFARNLDPSKPYPHYVFKLNFSIRAGVRLIFKSFEITPISYNYVVADNHDTKKKPYWERISGPWAPNPTSPTGEPYETNETNITQQELDKICIGSVSFTPQACEPDDDFIYGYDGDFTFNGQDLSITLDNERWNNLLTTGAPYENDYLPYAFQQGDNSWAQGTSDGLGIVTPDQEVTLLSNSYADPKFQYVECDGKRFLFFIAVVNVNGVKAPTLVYAQLTSENKIEGGKVHPILFGTENAQNPRYVTDFDVAGKKSGNQIQFETVVCYSKGEDATKSKMGIFVRPFRIQGSAPAFLPYRKELQSGFTYNYKALMPSIIITNNVWDDWKFKDQVCVGYLLQYDITYQSRSVSSPTVMMYARNADQDWKEDATQVASLNYPISQVYVGTGYSYRMRRDEYGQMIYSVFNSWRVSYVYNENRKFDDPSGNIIYSSHYFTEFENGKTHGADIGIVYSVPTSKLRGYNVQRVDNTRISFIGPDDKLNLAVYDRKKDEEVVERVYTSDFTMPHEGNSFFKVITSSDPNVNDRINYFYYWPEAVKYEKGSPEPNPAPKAEYQYMMGRMVSIEMKGKGERAHFSNNVRTTKPFILCKMPMELEYVRAYPIDGAYCGLFYTTAVPGAVSNSQSFTSDIHFARVPVVDAIEIPGLTPNDPCIAQGETFWMYTNIQNSGNTYLGKCQLVFTYRQAGKDDVEELHEVDLLDCHVMMPTENEFDYSELAEGEYFINDQDVTLAEAMKDSAMSQYFDAAEYADASDPLYGDGNNADQVKLKNFTPGDKHTYIVYYCNVPKQWTGAVTITSRCGALERREIWQSSYVPSGAGGLTGLTVDEMNAGTMYKDVPSALGGGYFAATNGASTTLGYSDIVIEGNLMRVGNEEYLELNLRNETTSPSNVLLKIYGDDTPLLTKEFQNVACGALDKYNGMPASNTMTALNKMDPYDNGYITEGYDQNPPELSSKNGYINLTFPVSALTQGREFYKLTAVLETPNGFRSIEGAESDSLEFILRQTGYLTIDMEPDNMTLKEGESGRMAASYTGGLPPYTVVWQRLDQNGDWHDLPASRVINGDGETAQSILNALIAKASASSMINAPMPSALLFNKATTQDAGEYRLVVTDKSGVWVASRWARLTVANPPPKTGDDFPICMTIIMLGLSLAGLAAYVFIRQQARRNQIGGRGI